MTLSLLFGAALVAVAVVVCFSMQRVISHRVWLSLPVYSSTSQEKCLQKPCTFLSIKRNITWRCIVGSAISLSVVLTSFAKKVAIDVP